MLHDACTASATVARARRARRTRRGGPRARSTHTTRRRPSQLSPWPAMRAPRSSSDARPATRCARARRRAASAPGARPSDSASGASERAGGARDAAPSGRAAAQRAVAGGVAAVVVELRPRRARPRRRGAPLRRSVRAAPRRRAGRRRRIDPPRCRRCARRRRSRSASRVGDPGEHAAHPGGADRAAGAEHEHVGSLHPLDGSRSAERSPIRLYVITYART